MKMKKSLLLALTAGAVAPVAAYAQLAEGDVVINNRSEIPEFVLNAQGQMVPVAGGSASFAPRGTVTVYDAFPSDTRAASIILSAGAWAGVSFAGEDISFANSLWSATPGSITQYSVPVRRITTPLLAGFPTNADLVTQMFDTGSMLNNPMTTGTPFFNIGNENIGQQLFTLAANGAYILTITPTVPVVVPGDSNIFLTYAWTASVAGAGNVGTQILAGPQFTPSFQARQPFTFWGYFNNQGNLRGATDEGIAIDWNGNGILEGGSRVDTASPGRVVNASEHRRIFIAATATPPTPADNFGVRLFSVMRGQVDQAAQEAFRPTTDQNLGTLANGETVSNVIATGSASANFRDRAAWFVFNVPGDVTDAASSWLDIDMEPTASISGNPAAPAFDPVMALYKNNGDLLVLGSDAGVDDDNGTGLLSQLSFGIGLRAPNGVGVGGDVIRNFDGVDGELLAADGPFYLGVTASQLVYDIEDGWSLEQGATVTGSVQVRLRTNANGPAPLDPAVPPFVDQELLPIGGFAGDPISAPGASGTAGLPGDPGYRVWKFTTCKNIEAADADATDWLDLDFDASEGEDQVVFLFNSNGSLVAENDDGNAAGLYFKPQLSFGNAGPRTPAGAAAGAAPFTGQNGGLPAGTYYAIVAFFGADTLATNDRFHVRPDAANDNLNLNVSLTTGLVPFECSPTGCDDIDFNNNEVFPEDQDVVDFFNVLAGADCPLCNDIDFNNNGVFPEDQDVIDFFNVLAGGSCP
ncbi:MAG: hypothetical protein ACK5ZG_02450 [Phycisphaerae bacterium]|jgi:hypothetical protein